MNTATSEILIEITVKLTSPLPSSAASLTSHALLDMSNHVLEHHDGVVDHEAGGDGKRHERQVVDAVMQEVHRPESTEDRDRQDHRTGSGWRVANAGK